MFGIYAAFNVQDGKLEQAVAVLEDLIKETRLEEGNISYKLYVSVENPNTVVFFEEWQDEEAMAAHSSSEHFKTGIARLREFLIDEGEIKVFKHLI